MTFLAAPKVFTGLMGLTLVLPGCASGAVSRDAPPRALASSPQAPSCLLLCFITQTFTDTEEDISSTGGNLANSVANEQTLSGPTLNLSKGTPPPPATGTPK